MKSVFFYNYPVGMLGIAEDNGAICRIFFKGETTPADFETIETPLIQKAAAQLTEYFAGKRRSFDLSLVLQGTDFQMSVWKTLQTIPIGETRSYKDVAVMIGNPRASRAVGMANNRNPMVIIVPCHRVTGQDGSMTGYIGGIPAKEYLLELERRDA
ncbi:methylated-DNA--[protein]-cysteine S-methyltransferase [Desulfosporosinus youngiae]|uniref:Methylated-DNA--protein-cysteine methyltransferase n=1 Tax=Desulfosporosinus youngiae DSM 17734 TaxID=768710 RepID=H5Y4Q9_9FIRM|nr:methylated-DNA--[protein]-cysteine S-methyltransferase [Desulfosporosinus youngiae]EHQ89795.1 O-6-methylguanine DNA methyltransferase [Desulfosporosinus youngiae DSM 17734]